MLMLCRPHGGSERQMLAIDARETAPASISPHVFYNTTVKHTGKAQLYHWSSLLSSFFHQNPPKLIFNQLYCTQYLHFSTPNRACPVYQTPPLFPYLGANYVTRSTTNVICLPQENCGRQIALVVDVHRLVFYLCVRPSPFLMDM